MAQRHRNNSLLRDVAVGALGGIIGTWLMPKVTKPLYKLESEEKRKREEELREKPPFQVLADKVDQKLGLDLPEKRKKKLGMFFHWGYGVGWGALYGLVCRRVPVLSKWGGLPFAVGFTLIGDELMNTALKLTAPPQKFPIEAHLRGLVGHVAFTAGADATMRAASRLRTS